MMASDESEPQEPAGQPPWLLLIHQLPPKPDYLRVKVRRRLKRLGAAAIKQTVYLLPNTDEALEDLQWLRQEIEADGGSALIAEASIVEGITDEEIEAMLDAARQGGEPTGATDVAETVTPGRTWVTRKGVFVDRIASAWLIKRRIDPEARFKFVPARGYVARAKELRFDMPGAEFSHVGEDCTFQTLLRRFALRDRALRAIGEVVHDIDCKDEKFGRPETAGIATLLRGIAQTCPDDAARLERGFQVFDDLLAYYRSRRA